MTTEDTPNRQGYRSFTVGAFRFERDEYFAHIVWPKGRHLMPVDAFLRALQRDVAWGFFYGTVNFDGVDRHRQPLRYGRALRRSVQPALQTGRPRLRRDASRHR